MKPIHILLVEDNEGDIILTLEALKDTNSFNTVSVVRDGEQAIQFLNRENKYTLETSPDLILLDINLPKIDGIEVLFYIKHKEELKQIPVIMLTTSTAEIDITEAYKNHANCYISKPVNLTRFLDIVQKIESFWISIAQLPKQ